MAARTCLLPVPLPPVRAPPAALSHTTARLTESDPSALTFGHFGRSGTFLWVDPAVELALACLTDLAFGDWAREAWPRLADAVLQDAA